MNSLSNETRPLDELDVTPSFSLRINAGGPAFIDTSGREWLADTGYTSGESWSTSADIANTNDSILYQTERWSADHERGLAYVLEVPSGLYEVRLHFAEIWPGAFTPGDRTFDVSIQGKRVLTNFDIVDEVGPGIATVQTFFTAVTNGTLHVLLTHGNSQNPKLSGIEVIARDNKFIEEQQKLVLIASWPNASLYARGSWNGKMDKGTATDPTSWLLSYGSYGSTVRDDENIIDWSALVEERNTSTMYVVNGGFRGTTTFYTRAEGDMILNITKRDRNRVVGKDRLILSLQTIDGSVLDTKNMGDDNNENDYGGFETQSQQFTFNNLTLRLHKLILSNDGSDDFTYDLRVQARSFYVAHSAWLTEPSTLYLQCILPCELSLVTDELQQRVHVDNQEVVLVRDEKKILSLSEGQHTFSTGKGSVHIEGFGFGSFNPEITSPPARFTKTESEDARFLVRSAPYN